MKKSKFTLFLGGFMLLALVSFQPVFAMNHEDSQKINDERSNSSLSLLSETNDSEKSMRITQKKFLQHCELSDEESCEEDSKGFATLSSPASTIATEIDSETEESVKLRLSRSHIRRIPALLPLPVGKEEDLVDRRSFSLCSQDDSQDYRNSAFPRCFSAQLDGVFLVGETPPDHPEDFRVQQLDEDIATPIKSLTSELEEKIPVIPAILKHADKSPFQSPKRRPISVFNPLLGSIIRPPILDDGFPVDSSRLIRNRFARVQSTAESRLTNGIDSAFESRSSTECATLPSMQMAADEESSGDIRVESPNGVVLSDSGDRQCLSGLEAVEQNSNKRIVFIRDINKEDERGLCLLHEFFLDLANLVESYRRGKKSAADEVAIEEMGKIFRQEIRPTIENILNLVSHSELNVNARINFHCSYGNGIYAGFTAMHIVAYHNLSHKFVNLLMNRGADIDSRNKRQQDPLCVALLAGHENTSTVSSISWWIEHRDNPKKYLSEIEIDALATILVEDSEDEEVPATPRRKGFRSVLSDFVPDSPPRRSK